MSWTVVFTKKSRKQREKLPLRVRELVEVIYAGSHEKAPY